MKKIILLLCLLGLCLPAFATNYYEISYKKWIDLESIEIDGPFRTFWLKDLNYKKTNGEYNLKDTKGKHVKYAMTKVRLYCGRRDLKVLYMAFYDNNADVINSGYLNIDNEIVPGTEGEIWYNFVCGLGR